MKTTVKQLLSAVLLLSVIFAAGCAKKDTADSDEMVLRLRMPTKVQTLDSGNSRGMYSGRVVGHICEALYTYDYLERPYLAIPELAEHLPEISDDLLTYTIRIKPGVYYQNDPCFEGGKGREVKAGDFVYALKRIANVKYRSQNWPFMKERFEGLDEFREYTKQFKKELDVDYSREVEGIKALDDYTLQLKLTKPWPQIIDDLLTDRMSAPVPNEAVEYYGKDIIRHPVGTGAYKLKIWQRGVYIELERNENWRGDEYPVQGTAEQAQAGLLADAGNPIPIVDRIIWRVIEEDQPAWMLLMRGELDGSGIPKDNFSDAVNIGSMIESQDMRDRGIKLVHFNDPSVYWIGFNFRDPVLGNNLPLRKAISRGFNREQYNQILLNGRMAIAHGFVAPGLNSYDPNIEKYGFSKYDLNEAKQLIQQAERINGGPIPALTLAMPGTDTAARQGGQFIQRQFNNMGLQLEVDYMDWPTYMDKVNKGEAQLFASGIGAGSPQALDFLDSFSSESFAPGSNKFFYSNPEYDELFEKVKVMSFNDDVKEMYRELERIAMADYPGVFTVHRTSYVMIHDWFENYTPHVFSRGPFGMGRYYKIDIEKRKAYKQRLKDLKRKSND